jgi:adenylosuccinate lyase
VERVFAPDATIALDFALVRLAEVVDRLVVYPDAMRQNLERLGGLVYSQAVLLALVEHGIAREEAYRYVQEAAMQVWQNGGSFEDRLWEHKIISTRMSREELAALFDPAPYLAHVDTIFERVFGPARRGRHDKRSKGRRPS